MNAVVRILKKSIIMYGQILNHIMLWSSPFRKKKFFSMPALAKQF